MWEIEATFLTSYTTAIANAFTAFTPLWAATVGIFLAFAIANMFRFFISRIVKM
jgi:hypothetical protein